MARDSGKGARFPEDILKEADGYGSVLAHRLHGNQDLQTLTLVFACVLDSEDIATLFDINPDHVHEADEERRTASPKPEKGFPHGTRVGRTP